VLKDRKIKKTFLQRAGRRSVQIMTVSYQSSINGWNTHNAFLTCVVLLQQSFKLPVIYVLCFDNTSYTEKPEYICYLFLFHCPSFLSWFDLASHELSLLESVEQIYKERTLESLLLLPRLPFKFVWTFPFSLLAIM
jgi:hypothetical protein